MIVARGYRFSVLLHTGYLFNLVPLDVQHVGIYRLPQTRGARQVD